LKLETLQVKILKSSELSTDQKLAAIAESVDAFTRRGHFSIEMLLKRD
jgi:hypothetical protein